MRSALGARRSALGARRSALGARRSALGSRPRPRRWALALGSRPRRSPSVLCSARGSALLRSPLAALRARLRLVRWRRHRAPAPDPYASHQTPCISFTWTGRPSQWRDLHAIQRELRSQLPTFRCPEITCGHATCSASVNLVGS
ncbi:MAG: hypothetical protein EOO73_25450 [Myxococcales bacterium]|nr:MAG: hypothetical protein EOO73_25450 [Myxococcales bacterium]